MSHIEPQADGCWYWMASRNWLGYGQWQPTARHKGTRLAHRWSYEFMVGPIPEGLVIDHLCGVRECVNPSHLEPVTQRENVLRSYRTQASINAGKTHCKRGHEFTEANTLIYATGSRACRQCAIEKYQRTRERIRSEQVARARSALGRASA